MKTTNGFTISIIMFLLSACGGGGSDGGTNSTSNSSSSGGSNNNYSINLSPSAVNITAAQAGTAEVFYITGTLTGELNVSTLYVDVDLDENIFRSVTLFQNEDSISAQIDTHDNLWGGTYAGNIQVDICSDMQCNSRLGNSPYTVPFNITIPPATLRYEPVNYSENVVVDFDWEFIAINVESGSPGVEVRYRTEYSEDIGQFVFPTELLEVFSVTNESSTGFTLSTPPMADGVYAFDYELAYSNSEQTRAFTIYYLVGQENGASDQFVFLENPIEVDVLYGQPNQYAFSRYLIVGEDRDVLDYVEFTTQYDAGAENWIQWAEGSGGQLNIDLQTEILDIGTYSATITGTTYHSQVSGDVSVVVNVVDGFVLHNPTNYAISFDHYGVDFSGQISVDNSRQAEGTWQVSTETPWIVLEQTEGNFLTAEDRANHENYHVMEFSINAAAVAALPNDYSGSGSIQFSTDDPRFPDTEVEIEYQKRFPEITTASISEVTVNQPFTVEITGKYLATLSGLNVYLRNVDDGSITEAAFTVNTETLQENAATLTHTGVTEPGNYEIAIGHQPNIAANYEIYFVPRPQLVVTE